MAFKMSIEAADGRTIEDAYWVPVAINISPISKTGLLTFYAYSSPAAMDDGKAAIAGADKSYAFTPEEFVASQMAPLASLFADGISGSNTLYEVLSRFAYATARARKDVATGQVDENGNPIYVSFFEEAVDA